MINIIKSKKEQKKVSSNHFNKFRVGEVFSFFPIDEKFTDLQQEPIWIKVRSKKLPNFTNKINAINLTDGSCCTIHKSTIYFCLIQSHFTWEMENYYHPEFKIEKDKIVTLNTAPTGTLFYFYDEDDMEGDSQPDEDGFYECGIKVGDKHYCLFKDGIIDKIPQENINVAAVILNIVIEQ